MLNNLKQIYQGERDYHRALRVQEILLCLHLGGAAEIRDRGFIYYRLACLGQAAADLESYLKRAPEAPDAAAIRERLRELRRLVPVMN